MRGSWQSSNRKRKHRGGGSKDKVAWEEYRDLVRACRDGFRKAKAQLELNLARGMEGNREGFCRGQKEE